jgi:hypothetical protein
MNHKYETSQNTGARALTMPLVIGSSSLHGIKGQVVVCVFGLAGDADVGAAKVFTRLIAHTVYAGIGPFQAIFIVLPIALHPIGRRLTRW